MPLKSLELVGYKTFASKNTFTFSDNITAVVGPNGSGKSNIADAIRWVLGEQSYSLLRGKKTIDMIFSGSQQRAPAGMASATVTFDNTDGWLPIDFTEVGITRRAYRDGQNEYLINNQKVRLKDVTELLGHSGLAERTYTIIGQGLVDAALSLKADERRKLFEEAAGIGVYRSRREEALRRLDKTRRNLERVKDILAELKPRLRSLDRQARRAAEHEQIKTDLHVLLREWYGYHWHHQQKDLTGARINARAQEKTLAETRSLQISLDTRIRDQRERIHDLRSMMGSWQEELGTLQNHRERISRDLAVAIERSRALEARKTETLAEQSRLTGDQELYVDRLDRIMTESERLAKRAEEAAASHAKYQQALDTRLETHEHMTGAIRDIERDIHQNESAAAGLRARMDELKIRLRTLEASRNDLEKNLAAAEDDLAEQETARREQAQKREHIETELGEAEQAAQQTQKDMRIREGELEDLHTSLRDITGSVTRLEAQLDVLEQAERSYAGFSEGARLLLEAAETGQITGIGPTLGGLIRVPAELTAAAAAAAGPCLEAVLAEDTSSRDQAVERLLENRAGGWILPENPQAGRAPVRADGPGVLGVLSELIEAEARYRDVINLVFGGTVAVRDRAAAEALRIRQPGEFDIVTLDGALYRADGAVSTAGAGEGGVLERRRQREELTAALADARMARTTAARQVEAMEVGLEQARETFREQTAALESLREAQVAARSAAANASSEYDRILAQVNWSRTQVENLQTEIRENRAAREQAEASLVEIDSALEKGRAALAEQRGELAEISMSDLQAQAAHWQTRAAVTRRAAEDALARAEDSRTSQRELKERLTGIENLLTELENAGRALKLEREKLAIEEEQVRTQVDQARSRIEPTEKELRELENRLDTTQEEEAEARKALTTAERNHSQAQINLARKQEALDNLRERIEDDFGLVAFDYADEVAGPNPLPLGNFVESLPFVESVPPELGGSIKRQRAQLRRMGAINPDALAEFKEVSERFEFLTAQVEDLNKAEADILETVNELDLLMEREFRKTFNEVAREFRETFTRLFGGGSARLVLTDPDDLTESGVDIEAQLPGRRSQGLSLLSGGERSLTATALVFSLIRVSPTPFCVLDEVDAMLDEANVNRLADLLRELSERTQFIVITHNRNTVQTAELIYGITMARDSTSQVLSLKLDEVADIV